MPAAKLTPRRAIPLILFCVIALPTLFFLGNWLTSSSSVPASDAAPASLATTNPTLAPAFPRPPLAAMQLVPDTPPTPAPPPANPNLPALRGGIGFGTWDTAAEFKDILVQSADRQNLLQLDFAKGIIGWQSTTGQWDGVNGTLTQSTRSVGCQITTGDANWTDYTFSMKARRTDGTEGFLVIFAEQNSRNLTWWNIGGWGNTRSAIEKMTNGGKREIPGSAVDLRVETGKWYDIKIELQGNTANCYFDGKLITTLEGAIAHSTLPNSGPPTVFNNGNGPQSRSAGGIPPATRLGR